MKIVKNLLLISVVMLSSCNSCTNEPEEQPITEPEVIEEPIEVDVIEDKPLDQATEVPDEIPSKINSDSKVEKVEPKPKVEEKTKEAPAKQKEEKTAKSTFVKAIGEVLPTDYKLDLTTFAAEDIYITKEGECGEHCGKGVYLVNSNSEKTVETGVLIQWKINKEKNRKEMLYNVKSGEKLLIGCTQNCTEKEVNIKWKITSAKYKD